MDKSAGQNNEAAEHLGAIYNRMINSSYRAEIYEFILERLIRGAEFKYSGKPSVSLIIPVKNEFILTCALLNSIKKNTQGIEYEVIIADDNSDDETKDIENIFKNAKRIVNNTGQEGYVSNMNNAAAYARGEFILMLHNDVILTPFYLDILLNLLQNNQEIGIAGSKTLNIDDTVLSCGFIQRTDGGFEALGFDEPENYMDDKDYIECSLCSGASMLLKRSVWEKAGGFNSDFAPAFYETADFAFNLKYNYGLKTVCAPKSKVFHFEEISYCSNDLTEKLKEEHKALFLKKWGS